MQAKRLCTLLVWHDDEVRLKSDLHTVGDVRRVAAVLPGDLQLHAHPSSAVSSAVVASRSHDRCSVADQVVGGSGDVGA